MIRSSLTPRSLAAAISIRRWEISASRVSLSARTSMLVRISSMGHLLFTTPMTVPRHPMTSYYTTGGGPGPLPFCRQVLDNMVF